MPVDIRDQMIGHLPRLRRFVLAITSDAIDADALMQQTCLKAVSNLNQFQVSTRLDSWLFRIAKNAGLDKFVGVSLRTDHVHIDTTPEVQDPIAHAVVESRAALRDTSWAIAQLPRRIVRRTNTRIYRRAQLRGNRKNDGIAYWYGNEPLS